MQDVVISMGDFPVQMESFPAADEDQFEFIKSLIDKCDYYLLITAGRYGSVSEDGLSYTHKEFRYAVSQNVPVLVMVHGQPGSITADKLETTDAGKESLRAFISEAEHKRLRKSWSTLGDLKLAVREALDHAKATKPRIGWVRGDSIASLDALEELNRVRKENQEIRDALGNLAVDIPLPSLPAANDLTTVSLNPMVVANRFDRREGSAAIIEASWIAFFPIMFSNMEVGTYDSDDEYYHFIEYDKSCVAIGSAIANEMTSDDTTGLFKISRNSVDRLIAYYREAGLMLTDNVGMTPFTKAAERVARRFHIAGSSEAFVIVEGKVSVSDSDEVPF